MEDWSEIVRTKKFKIIVAVFLGIFLVAAGLYIFNIAIHNGKVKVVVSYLPKDASVYLNHSSENVNNKTLYLEPGAYNISAYARGYIYNETSLDVTKYTAAINGVLLPTDADSEEIAKYEEMKEKNSHTAYRESFKRLTADYPIIEYLPVNVASGQYSITYELKDNDFQINVGLGTHNDILGASVAQEVLKGLDKLHSISQYRIIFNDIDNPFDSTFNENSEGDPVSYLETGFKSVKNKKVTKGAQSGDYYYTVIQKFDSVSQLKEIGYLAYRVVLKKDGDGWKLVDVPNILLTKYNSPNVPVEVLDLVNFYDKE